MHPDHALQEHGQKDCVHADERGPEMHLSPEVAHLSSSGLWKPIINPRKDREDRPRRDDVVEVRDHVIGVVQVKIGTVKRQRNARQAADPEHRQESRREKHRHREPNRPAPQRDEKRA